MTDQVINIYRSNFQLLKSMIHVSILHHICMPIYTKRVGWKQLIGPAFVSSIAVSSLQEQVRFPTNITLDQFMFWAVTGVCRGQKAKKVMGVKKHKEAILTTMPYLPSDHRCAGRGPCVRRQIKQLMVM
ncbi:hypothetical protein EYC80_008159 [Monilinia laxa]|uniref:Uncharacterized protein n=1 Tax=Monilinia laxa TaxID=61186 RepID=A0A5N6JTN4_MONLA|nr:hypothetical protein EYC80_008159 [Monilinia laxa]